jgi:copper ion binding protein
MKKYSFPVEGMTCASCVARVEKIIGKFDGVKNVTVNLANERVTFDTNKNIDLKIISNAVEEYGYKLIINQLAEKNTDKSNKNDETKDEFYVQLKNEFLIAFIFTLPVFAISMLMDFHFFHALWPFSQDYTNKILLVLTTPIIFISGKRFFQIFWKNLKHLSFEMNSLVAIGTGSAYGFSLIATLFPSLVSKSGNHTNVYFETA